MNNYVYIFKEKADFSFIEINQNDWVVIKPNLVKECNPRIPNEWESVVTSGKLIRNVCEYVANKLRGTGRITICDAPQTDSSFAIINQKLGLQKTATDVFKATGVPVDVLDLRDEEWFVVDEIVAERRKLKGDPEGSVSFNLGRQSLFYGHKGEGRYYGADYNSEVTNLHHQGDRHEYLICKTPILADVYINMPKMKTHKKTGVTLNLKNLVGINADKNWLPHHTNGCPTNGGDQFPDESFLQRGEQICVKMARSIALKLPYVGPFVAGRMRSMGKMVFGGDSATRSGNWYGNDTTWRMVLDLNRCLLYGNADGTLRSKQKKKYYCVIDGLIGMDGDGPMCGDKLESGLVIGGSDPVATDMVAARVMGFDWRKIPVIHRAFEINDHPITSLKPCDVEIKSNIAGWSGNYLDIEKQKFLTFRPHTGWRGHIEYEA